MENKEVLRGYDKALPAIEVVGNSPETKRLRRAVKRAAKVSQNLLLIGETGTGKSFVANLIHTTSNRKNKSLIKINCSAYGGTVTRKDLFGEDPELSTSSRATLGLLEKANG